MVSQETLSQPAEPTPSPRISFSADFLDEKSFISISPNPQSEKDKTRREEFEFLSTNNSTTEEMLSAEELFFEGKLLPFFQIHQCEKLNNINLKEEHVEETQGDIIDKDESNRMGSFIDEDPSPRPPNCTVLWKELLRLKKQRACTLSPSSSSSSYSSVADVASDKGKREKNVNRVKNSPSIRIRPVVNVPIRSHGRSSGLPPLFSFKKGKLER